MSSKKYSTNKRVVRHLRIRKKLAGTSLAPRLAVFRSNKKIYAQVIDDDKNITLTSASSIELKSNKKIDDGDYSGKCSESYKVGVQLAEKCNKSGIDKLIFDRGGYKFHGRIKALADGVRKGGVSF